MSPRLLLVAHGTRSAAGRATVEGLRDSVAGLLPGVTVALAWVDLLEPRPEDVLADGVATVVVPCFLGEGYHVRTDVAGAVGGAPGDAVMTEHLGSGPGGGVASVHLHRAREAGPADAYVLAAAGSRDPRSRADTVALAELLAEALGAPVAAAYASAAEPTVADAVDAFRREGSGRVVVFTHLLAPGFFADRIANSGGDHTTPPLGDSRDLAQLIARRYSCFGDDSPAVFY